MVTFVIILGLLIGAAGVFGLAAPARMATIASGMQFSEGLRYLAAYGRMLIGIVLFFAAYQTKFSLAIQILAMFSVLAGVIVLVMRRETMEAWIARVTEWPPGTLRAVGALALAAGAFLVYAAV